MLRSGQECFLKIFYISLFTDLPILRYRRNVKKNHKQIIKKLRDRLFCVIKDLWVNHKFGSEIAVKHESHLIGTKQN